jgi:hypothetical protein
MQRLLLRALLILVVAWASAIVAHANAFKSPLDYVEGPKSSIYTGSYRAEELRSFGDLPADVQAKLTTHLTERFGENYFRRLSVSDGQIVDHEEMHRIDPGTKNYQWTVFAYRVGFRISAPEKGIKEYNGYIELNRDGSILREIEFPNVAIVPWKAEFVSFASAMHTAESLGATVAQARVQYCREEDAIVFVLQEAFRPGLVSENVRSITINAHSGAVLSDKRHLLIR